MASTPGMVAENKLTCALEFPILAALIMSYFVFKVSTITFVMLLLITGVILKFLR